MTDRAIEEDLPEWLRPDEALPRLPPRSPRLEVLLERLGVRTLGQLYRLRPASARELPGVGGIRVAELRRYRQRVLDAAGAPDRAPAPGSQPPADWLPLEAPLPSVPGLIQMALVSAGVRTLGDLMSLEDSRLRTLRGVGPRKIQRIIRYREELLESLRAEHIARTTGLAATPELWRGARDLPALCRALRDEMSAKEEYIFFKRYLKGDSLQATAAPLQISRERVRQLQRATLERLHLLAGGSARVLLLGALGRSGGALPERLTRGQLGEDAPSTGELHLLAEVATGAIWRRDGDQLQRATGGGAPADSRPLPPQ